MKNSNRNTANTHEQLTQLSRFYKELIEAFDEVSVISDKQLEQSQKSRFCYFLCNRFLDKNKQNKTILI